MAAILISLWPANNVEIPVSEDRHSADSDVRFWLRLLKNTELGRSEELSNIYTFISAFRLITNILCIFEGLIPLTIGQSAQYTTPGGDEGSANAQPFVRPTPRT